MFGRDKPSAQQIDTLIGVATRIAGDIEFSGGFHLDGHVKGNVSAPADSASRLSISEGSEIEGSVSVPYVILSGTVKGDITALERIELGATARVTGNVYYGLIEMAIGAEINGKLVHDPSRVSAKSTKGSKKLESPSAAEPVAAPAK
jgi:cytoskeletal protein CcmA (bactofilin family)